MSILAITFLSLIYFWIIVLSIVGVVLKEKRKYPKEKLLKGDIRRGLWLGVTLAGVIYALVSLITYLINRFYEEK